MPHDFDEGSDDGTATRIVGAHETQPETVFLGTIEYRPLLPSDIAFAFHFGNAHGIALLNQISK